MILKLEISFKSSDRIKTDIGGRQSGFKSARNEITSAAIFKLMNGDINFRPAM